MKKLLGILVLGLLLSSNALAGWEDNEKIVACGSSYENTGGLRTTYYAYNKEYIWYDWSVPRQTFLKSVPVTRYDKKKIKVNLVIIELNFMDLLDLYFLHKII